VFVQSTAREIEIHPLGQATVVIPATVVNENPTDDPQGGEPVKFNIELDVAGNGNWIKHTTLSVAPGTYQYLTIPKSLNAIWLRLTADRNCVATAFLHLTADFSAQPTAQRSELFKALADTTDSHVHAARLYASQRSRNLQVIDGDNRHFDFTKESFEFTAQEPDENLENLLKTEPTFSVDEASVVLKYKGINLRLPKGSAAFDQPLPSGWPRAMREVESERILANMHGTFYEVPLVTNGQPPAFDLLRPIASHSKQITDYCSWNGLLVLAGVRIGAPADEHVFSSPALNQSLWFGGIDDLWQLGKPVGTGGPWNNSAVKAGVASDRYLMTGYDHKTLLLSADIDTAFKLEVDIDHQSGWHLYQRFNVTAGQVLRHEFPTEYSAHWLRITADHDCNATATLHYR
jgi:hypothetical protein